MSNGRLWIEYRPLSELAVWPTNPKRHDTAGIGASMREYSYTDPIMVDETTGRMVRGHGRREVLLAFKEAGEPPPEHVDVQDGTGEWLVPVLRGVAFENEAEAEEYVVADNQLVIAGDRVRKPRMPGAGVIGKDPRIPPAGTVIRKTYKGTEYALTILEDGVELAGEKLKNLEAALGKITGKHNVSSMLFFGLVGEKPAPAPAAAAE